MSKEKFENPLNNRVVKAHGYKITVTCVDAREQAVPDWVFDYQVKIAIKRAQEMCLSKDISGREVYHLDQHMYTECVYDRIEEREAQLKH